jgi:hypothetical protein
MTDHDNPTRELTTPTRQPETTDGRSAPLKVTGRLAKAIEQMVWFGAPRAAAAELAGLKDHSLRSALKKAHVLRHYHAELGVLRESTRAKNFHRLDSIADEAANGMARVAAIKVMEQISNDPLGTGAPGMGGARAGYLIDLSDEPRAGVVIVIQPPREPQQRPGAMIDITPNTGEDDTP